MGGMCVVEIAWAWGLIQLGFKSWLYSTSLSIYFPIHLPYSTGRIKRRNKNKTSTGTRLELSIWQFPTFLLFASLALRKCHSIGWWSKSIIFLSEKWFWYILVSVKNKIACACWAGIDLGVIDWERVGNCEGREEVAEEPVRVRKLIVQLTWKGSLSQFLPLWMYLKSHPMKCNCIF